MDENRNNRIQLYRGRPVKIRRIQDVHPGIRYLRRADTLAVDRLTDNSRARVRAARVRRNDAQARQGRNNGIDMARVLRPNVRETNENPEGQALNRSYSVARAAVIMSKQGGKKAVRTIQTRKARATQREKIKVTQQQIRQLRAELRTIRTANTAATNNAENKAKAAADASKERLIKDALQKNKKSKQTATPENISVAADKTKLRQALNKRESARRVLRDRKFYKIRPASELLKLAEKKTSEQTPIERKKRSTLHVLQARKRELKKERKATTKTDLGGIFAASILQKGVGTVKDSLSQGQDASAATYAEEMARKSAYMAADKTQKAAAAAARKGIGTAKKAAANAKSTATDIRINKVNIRTNGTDVLRHNAPKVYKTQELRTAQTAKKAANTVNATVQNQAKAATAKKAAAKIEQAAAEKVKIQAQKMAATAARRSYEIVKQILVAMAKAVKTIALSAGAGGFFLTIFVLIFGAAAAFASPWGIFYGEEDPSETGLKEAIQELSADWLAEIDTAGGYGGDNDFGSETAAIPDLYEILCVYAVYTSTDTQNPQDVATMTPEKKEILRQVIRDMRSISSETVTVTSIDPDTGDEIQVQETRASIIMRNWQEMIAFYGFTSDQSEALEQLINEDSMFRQLMESLGYNPIGNSGGQISEEEWQQILQNAGDMDAIQAALVEYARQFLGYRYSQTNPPRGSTYYEDGQTKMYMDCSYFTRHIYRSIGVEIAGTAGEQKRWSEQNGCLVDTNNLQVGDLVFFRSPGNTDKYEGITHVGLYIGGGKIIDASASNGKVVCRNLWTSGDPYLYAAARPLATTV